MPDPVLLRRLAENSVPYRDPLAAVNWRELEAAGRWLPDEALRLLRHHQAKIAAGQPIRD